MHCDLLDGKLRIQGIVIFIRCLRSRGSVMHVRHEPFSVRIEDGGECAFTTPVATERYKAAFSVGTVQSGCIYVDFIVNAVPFFPRAAGPRGRLSWGVCRLFARALRLEHAGAACVAARLSRRAPSRRHTHRRGHARDLGQRGHNNNVL